jgi:tetratricopeptide (TPR) repeat protein
MTILAFASFLPPARAAETQIEVGVIGCDTSHVIAFTQLLNRPENTGDLEGVRVVAAYPGGSPDIPSSADRVEGYTQQLREMGVEIVDSIPALLEKVDAVLLESLDGRPHLEQARPVFEAKKPVFIDKPVAGSLADAIAIYRLAREHEVPCFSSSSLRFSPGILGMRNSEQVGQVLGVAAYSPCSLEPHHPDLFWYGIHGVELLYTIMGPGCERVSRAQTEGQEHVTGVWGGGRIGTYRGIRDGKSDYGATVFGTAGIAPSGGYAGYEPLVVEIAKFFKTGVAPVSPEETIELFAFMEAADESKRQDGRPVTLASVIEQAEAELTARASADPAGTSTSTAEDAAEAEKLLAEAVAAAQAGRLEEAAELAAKVRELDPKNASAHLLLGRIHLAQRKYAEAEADFTALIEVAPDNAEAYDRRGDARLKGGKIEESIADFDEFLRRNPDFEPHHWRRGIAYYYAGRFEDGVKQFDTHQTVNSADVENAVWRYLCQAKVEGVEKAQADLLKIGEDRRVPMRQVYELFAGRATPADVMAAAEAGEVSAEERTERLFYAHLYLALWHDAQGHADQARADLRAAVEDHVIGHYMWDVGKVHLERLP